MPRANAILGCAFSYDSTKVRAFVNSWRKNVATADCWLFVGPGDTELAKYLRDAGVNPVVVAAPDRFNLVNHQNRILKLWRIGRLLPTIALRQKFLRSLLRTEVYRHFIYVSWLRAAGLAPMTKVLLTDTRDVFFQADPFDEIEQSLVFCEERDGHLHRASASNSRWGHQVLGDERFEQIADTNIICAGTIFGKVESIIEFLDLFCQLLPTMRWFSVADQPIVNWMIRTGRLRLATVCDNTSGPVIAMRSMKNDQFRFDSADRVIRLDGKPFSMLHQYDFHPSSQKAADSQLQSTGDTSIASTIPIFN